MAEPKSLVEPRVIDRVNSNLRKIKNIYYQSFKTLFGD